jgi:hypothetical protein
MADAERRAVDGILKGFALTTVKAVNTAERTVDFTISLGSVDRQGDTVNPDGWELDNYLNNPVVLFAHDNRNPPIARALKVWREKGVLKSRSQFTPKDMYPFGFMIFEMYVGGFMKAVSVGFAPKDYKFVSGDERPFGIDFLKQELLEYSAVPVPAHPGALIEAKSAGIDTRPMKQWAERVLDGLDHGAAERASVERLHKASDPTGRSLFTITQSLRLPDDRAKADDGHILMLDDEEEVDIESMPPYRKSDDDSDDVDLSTVNADEFRSLVEAEVKRGIANGLTEALVDATGKVPQRRIR